MEFSTIYFNEASELDYSSVQIALSRLAEKNMLKKRVWFDFNPPSKSHWSYWLFIKKLDPIESEPLRNPDDYGHLLMNPKDNLENIDEDYLSILEAMPARDRERFLNGTFSDESEGQAYYSFSRERHVKEVKKVNVPVMIGMDFNVNPMTAVAFQIVNGNMHVIKEFYLPNSDTFKMADAIKRAGYTGAYVYPDSTGSNRKTSGMSDFDILKQSGFTIKSVHNPLQRDRVNNVNRLFTNDRIIIDSSCKKLIGDLEQVVWKNNKLDEGKKQLTHVSDAFGYPAWNLLNDSFLVKRSYQSRR